MSLAIIDQYAAGQDEDQAKIPISILNDTKADQIIENLEKIIEQNDNASRSGVISSYIGMMAFLVGLVYKCHVVIGSHRLQENTIKF